MIVNGDCLVELKKLKENSVDSVVTDPPYELGFMGKSWDSTGIANNVDMWSEVLRVLKPGGHLLSFGGTRTYHRMACAIEDAGFEIRDQIQWIYASGFPKSHNIGKAVDKLEGNEREDIGKYQSPENTSGGKGRKFCHGGQELDGLPDVTKGNSKWEGWGTALKPANEPIVLARKPLSEKTIAKNVLRWGTGGINIDESRVGTGAKKWSKPKGGIWNKSVDNGAKLKDNPKGRFPANLIHDGSDEVVSRFPETKTNSTGKNSPSDYKTKSVFGVGTGSGAKPYSGNSGSASRFFYCAKSSKSERNAGLEGFEEIEIRGGGGRAEQGYDDSKEQQRLKGSARKYGAVKTKKANTHPTVKPVKLMRYLVKLITPPGGTVLDPFMGSGTTGVACDGFKFIGIEMDKEYCKIAEARINAIQPRLFN